MQANVGNNNLASFSSTFPYIALHCVRIGSANTFCSLYIHRQSM